MLFIYGLLMPFLVVYCYFYWFGDHWFFVQSYFIRGLSGPRSFDLGWYNLAVAGGLLFFLIFLSWLRVVLYGRYANFQSKIQQVMILILLAGVGIIFLDVERGVQHLILFVPTLSVYIAHYLLLLRPKWFTAPIPYLIVAALLVHPHMITKYMVEPEAMDGPYELPETETLMYLGENLRQYRGYKIASPFLDSELSSYWLERLDYYQPAGHLYAVLERSAPELIYDEQGVVNKIFMRYPELENRYAREGIFYRRRD